uniref:L1 transposable element RRM domain-containing protein n=1 Tax=Sinocyclocheilus anshuiensis TaxID=1608454 RepID=A0A671RD98_9TELE
MGSKEKQSLRKEADMAGKEVTELLKTLKDEIKEFRREFQVFSKDTKQEIGELRNDVKELKGTVGDLKMQIQQVEKRVAEGEEKQTDYLENESRQNNIRIYRIKEGSEGTDIVGFVERLLKEACGITEHLTILQVHRISATKIPNERPQPRSIVREITYEGNKVYFDQDFTIKILEQRNSSRWMRQKLQEKHIKTHFRYPVKLTFSGRRASRHMTVFIQLLRNTTNNSRRRLKELTKGSRNFNDRWRLQDGQKFNGLVWEIWTTGSSTF